MDSERRFARVYKNWLVHYRHPATTAESLWSVGSVMNLSEGGVCFRTEESLNVGIPLLLQFNFPWKMTTSIRGTVVWRKQVGEDAREYGVAFEPMDEETRELINQFVAAWVKRQGERGKGKE